MSVPVPLSVALANASGCSRSAEVVQDQMRALDPELLEHTGDVPSVAVIV